MFLNNTRSKNWYKGKDAQSIISPFRDSLLSFAELYPLMQKEDAIFKSLNINYNPDNSIDLVLDSLYSKLITKTTGAI
jgi:hypothetical protein